ncbi:putative regulatory protein, FmdB family [Humidesulfovibrio mexicanus]|jgi:putative FmdB family regulatory protein|uniref:Putative regulatory protein, FmdB family n=1 Tax=Humidesulfovibrio mexicanus TaxID=147047 RepID=A0A239ASJ0_9BACT|nr:zinc ribbon domain-containing protein [Humidesulfovibrio mexicanus]SNR98675.1 putative regulatory protein, FmdB family [Humidesulfovibrio mexicanus]
MPIYEYHCQDCKQIFEEWQKDYEERDIPCPVCGGTARRIISSSSFVLKGGGWYANGYSGGSGASAQTGASAPAAPAAESAPTAQAPASPQCTGPTAAS